jgi:hypothetical protein
LLHRPHQPTHRTTTLEIFYRQQVSATNPEDAFLGPPPEVEITCEHCGREGGYEKHIWVYERGCGFGHDDSMWVTCEACGGWCGPRV